MDFLKLVFLYYSITVIYSAIKKREVFPYFCNYIPFFANLLTKTSRLIYLLLVIEMVFSYDVDKTNRALFDFYNATGITIDLLKSDFTKVSNTKYEFNKYCRCIRENPKGENACKKSELALLEKCKSTKETQMHICHAGLLDMVSPIIYDNEIIGYIIFGQMRADSSFTKLEKYIHSLGLDTQMMQYHYNKIPFYDSDKIQSVSNIADMLVKYILLENMLKPNIEKSVQGAINFIEENLEKKLTIKSISRQVNVSKTVLYNKFHSYFNCTISEYINQKRVEKSIEYLIKTDLSMEEISQKVGFSSASYYSKIFKRLKGTSPLKYKKVNSK